MIVVDPASAAGRWETDPIPFPTRVMGPMPLATRMPTRSTRFGKSSGQEAGEEQRREREEREQEG
jgi:hypothetical protein